eukprot:6426505-Ditylum_brightwellii.AAC.1
MQESTVSAITETQSPLHLQKHAGEYCEKSSKCMDEWEQAAPEQEKEWAEAEKEILEALEIFQNTAQQSQDTLLTSKIDELIKKLK